MTRQRGAFTLAALCGSMILGLEPVLACGFSRLAEVNGITAICCESLEDDDCSAGFPNVCSYGCADVLVPFWEECATLMSGVAGNSFNFDVAQLGTFAGNCKNTRSLVHFSNGVCSEDNEQLQARVADIQTSCCVQDGVNLCSEGTPLACNAQCAVPFMTCVPWPFTLPFTAFPLPFHCLTKMPFQCISAAFPLVSLVWLALLHAGVVCVASAIPPASLPAPRAAPGRPAACPIAPRTRRK